MTSNASLDQVLCCQDPVFPFPKNRLLEFIHVFEETTYASRHTCPPPPQMSQIISSDERLLSETGTLTFQTQRHSFTVFDNPFSVS